jgi:hypothetical protein
MQWPKCPKTIQWPTCPKTIQYNRREADNTMANVSQYSITEERQTIQWSTCHNTV